MRKSCASHAQVMCKSCASHLQLICKSMQVICKSLEDICKAMEADTVQVCAVSYKSDLGKMKLSPGKDTLPLSFFISNNTSCNLVSLKGFSRNFPTPLLSDSNKLSIFVETYWESWIYKVRLFPLFHHSIHFSLPILMLIFTHF